MREIHSAAFWLVQSKKEKWDRRKEEIDVHPQLIAGSLNTDKNTSYISFIAAVFAKH
jgi:hypothetical protein